MKSVIKNLALLLTTAVLLPASAMAEVSLNGIRLTAPDTEVLAGFYKTAFGMHEVQRIVLGPGSPEIMLDFGATEAEAKANSGGDVVLYPRAADEPQDSVAHLIFNVTDMAGTVAAIKAAGGSMEREPFGFGDTGILIGMGLDPAGNHFELLYFPPAPAAAE